METAIINEMVKGCNLHHFLNMKINQPDSFFHVIIKPVEAQPFDESVKKSSRTPALKVKDLNRFFEKLPQLGEDAESFAKDVSDVRKQTPMEYNLWD